MNDIAEKQRAWLEAMTAKGHTPVMEDGELNFFVYSIGYHNGPGCAVCGWSTCWHCAGVADIPECRK